VGVSSEAPGNRLAEQPFQGSLVVLHLDGRAGGEAIGGESRP
jgi:hypothetical protein